MPKGSPPLPGSWRRNKSNFMFGGRFSTPTTMTSAGPKERIVTSPRAPSRHPLGGASGRTFLKEPPWLCAAAVPARMIPIARIVPRTSSVRLVPRFISSPLFGKRSGGTLVLLCASYLGYPRRSPFLHSSPPHRIPRQPLRVGDARSYVHRPCITGFLLRRHDPPRVRELGGVAV